MITKPFNAIALHLSQVPTAKLTFTAVQHPVRTTEPALTCKITPATLAVALKPTQATTVKLSSLAQQIHAITTELARIL